jgi:hypothetical protein
MLLIGSKAIKHWYPDFTREPKDTDYIVDKNELFLKEPGIEYLENPIIFNLYKNKEDEIISPDHLVTLKASHLCWNINWEKHMFDVQFLLKKGHKINVELFLELYEYWNVYHLKNKRSDLKMTKDEFFSNAINKDVVEHDEIHKILNPIPAYTKILKDGAEVEVDEEKYKLLSHQDKINVTQEEIFVMAYERFKKMDYRTAYSIMLKKFIISHTPLFTLPFIIENYIELHKPNFNFIKQIENGLQSIKQAV